jgi:SAM-dependent methyltransferase
MRWEDVTPEQVQGMWNDPPADLAVLLAENLPPNSLVLDVGCGAGRHLRYLRDRGHRPVGIDPSSGQLKAVREVFPEIPVYPLELNEKFPFKTDTFHGVLSTYAIYHAMASIIHWTIAESIRVLRQGGLFYVYVISTRDFKHGIGPELERNTFAEVRENERGDLHHFFDLAEIAEVCSSLSYVSISHEERPLDPDRNHWSSHAWDKVCAHWIVKGRK